jgi:hypothetical protein
MAAIIQEAEELLADEVRHLKKAWLVCHRNHLQD